jgi:NADPH:quinone reductase-like Zn-dependent oxidoreductase
MRAIVVSSLGDPNVPRLVEVPPGPRQVLVRLTVSRVLPLEDAAEAYRPLESRQAVGEVLLRPL